MSDVMSHDDFCEEFANGIDGTADWRRRKAEEHPDDASRNVKAAEELEALARQAGEGKVDPALSAAYIEAHGEDGDDNVTRAESEALRRVGFWSSFETPNELLSAILHDAKIDVKPVA